MKRRINILWPALMYYLKNNKPFDESAMNITYFNNIRSEL